MRLWRYATPIVLGLVLLAAGRLWVRREAPPEEAAQGDGGTAAETAPRDGATEAAEEGGRLFVLAINGGGSAVQNYKSHLLHLQGLVDLLHTAGVPEERITVLAGDGGDPAPDLVERAAELGPEDWRLYGTEAEEHFSHLAFLGNSTVTGAKLYPATRGALSIWLLTVGQQLGAGDTLLLYVTDHGTMGAEPDGNRIVLWGPGASLSVRELRETLETLAAEVRVVSLMSQCFSGGFAKLATVDGTGEPTGRFCGFFSTTAQQKAYGCYPETQDNPRVGHSFAFLQALPSAAGDLPTAHGLALELDDTPDVPVRTSDLYLAEVLTAAARARKLPLVAFVDELLGANAPGLTLQTQRLDRLAERFGLPGVRSRAELAKVAATLQEALAQLGPLAAALGKSLAQSNQEQLRRFWELRPDLKAAVDPTAVKAMDVERRVRFAKVFLYDLATFSGRQVPTVKTNRDVITRMLFRMQVRLAAVARIQTVLDGVAGERYLADRPAQRASLQRLVDCEALDLQLPGAEGTPPGPALPPLGQDLLQLKHIVARDGLDRLVQQQAPSAGQEIPELRLVPYRGDLPPAQKPLLLFFWATWCKACKVVVPPLLTWAQQRDLTVLAITDEDAATLDQFFVVRQPFPPLIARDPDKQVMFHLGVRNLPSFALLDSQRRLVGPLTGSLRELPMETVE